MVCSLAAIVATGSRMAMVGILLFLAGRTVIRARGLWRIVLSTVIVSITLMVIAIVVRRYSVQQLPYQLTAERHDRIAIKGLLASTQRPVLGWGWTNFDYAFRAVDWPYRFEIDAYVDKAHGHYLEHLVTTGIVGLTAYFMLQWAIIRALWSKRSNVSRYFLLSFLLFIFHSQTNVISISQELIFWFIAGVSMVKKRG